MTRHSPVAGPAGHDDVAIAQVKALRVQTCIAHDADEQARNLHGWTQTYDQLTAGSFVGMLTELSLDHMHVFCETTSHTLRQTCEVPSDAYWFGIPVRRDVAGRIDANIIGDDAIAFRPGGIEFELITPAGYEIFGVVVKREVLRRHALDVERCGLSGLMPETEVVPVGEARKTRLCASLRHILADGVTCAAPPKSFSRDALEFSVLASLFDLCEQQRTDSGAIPARSRRQSVVSEAREYVLANRERPVGVPELCDRLHVSRRTLQYCFQDVLGMAPATYLRTIRLNGARRELCEAAHASRAVQDVAAAWGFWHLSQFATDYRKLFGKRPSDTLREAASGRNDAGRVSTH
ncbi:helix-turn-helix domain-containing protein [Paraburkholderia saeva]|uniref:helix-turn-helix domain-containing protein n=1 Tax=Paraburkholderia saeva TaxID=2777537 RepID=UPI001D1EAA82|nr:helix-turn-helix domain-containing protein [Paraburkholderia saeva]CAG4911466.1 HTH-type transcriptional activator RhaS [Paraburkholderia saeva]